MRISFVVAMDRHRAIGLHNQLPWHLPADLKYFRQLTSGHTIVMGRKTYESIGKPLPNRRNVILTQQVEFKADGCEIVHSIEELRHLDSEEECFVIGGAEVFKLLLPQANRMYITYIEHEFVADTFFPAFSSEDWKLVSHVLGNKDEKNPYQYYFQIYEKQ